MNLPELIDKLKEKNAEVVIEDKNALDDFYSGYSYALMHNKFCVFDEKTVWTGSYNPTNSKNLNILLSSAKNVLSIKSFANVESCAQACSNESTDMKNTSKTIMVICASLRFIFI